MIVTETFSSFSMIHPAELSGFIYILKTSKCHDTRINYEKKSSMAIGKELVDNIELIILLQWTCFAFTFDPNTCIR